MAPRRSRPATGGLRGPEGDKRRRGESSKSPQNEHSMQLQLMDSDVIFSSPLLFLCSAFFFPVFNPPKQALSQSLVIWKGDKELEPVDSNPDGN